MSTFLQFQPSLLQISNDLSLNYVSSGVSGGNPVLFLHGYMDSWFSYAQLLKNFPQKYLYYALDLRGHGDSSKPNCCYSIDDFVNDVKLFLGVLGLDKVSIVGHSMGSLVGQRFSALYPECVAKLVLISSTVSIRGNQLLASLGNEIYSLSDPVDESFIRDFQEPSVPIPSYFMNGIISESKKVPAFVWKSVFNELLLMDNQSLLHDVSADTLVVWGNRDSVFSREEQDVLLASIHSSSFIEYDAGHALHWEIPELFLNDLCNFI